MSYFDTRYHMLSNIYIYWTSEAERTTQILTLPRTLKSRTTETGLCSYCEPPGDCVASGANVLFEFKEGAYPVIGLVYTGLTGNLSSDSNMARSTLASALSQFTSETTF